MEFSQDDSIVDGTESIFRLSLTLVVYECVEWDFSEGDKRWLDFSSDDGNGSWLDFSSNYGNGSSLDFSSDNGGDGDESPQQLPEWLTSAEGPCEQLVGQVIEPAMTTPAPAVQFDIDDSGERVHRLSPGHARGERLTVSGRVCAPWAGPILRRFFGIIGQMPTKRALSSIRGLFTFTGKITQEQSRGLKKMVAPLEAHAEQINASLRNPRVLASVTAILAGGNRRQGDCQDAMIHADRYLRTGQPA